MFIQTTCTSEETGVPFPRFACWEVSSPSPKTHPVDRMAARRWRLNAGRLSLVLLQPLRSWRSLLRGKIWTQIFPVREHFARLFPRVTVRRVSVFFLRKQLTVFHRPWLWSVGAVFCNGCVSLGSQLPRTAKAGICFTAFYPVSACKGGGRFVVGADNRDLQNLRRCGQYRHGRHWFCNFYDGNAARQNCGSH